MTRSRKKTVLRLVVICTLLAPVVAATSLVEGQGQSAKSNSRAVEAARSRQDRIKTLVVEYKRTEVTSAGGITEAMPPPMKSRATKPVPEKETTLESTSRIILDGRKYRFEDNHQNFQIPSGAILHRSLIHAFNDNLGKNFAPKGHTGQGPPSGVIEKGVDEFRLKLLHVMPLMVTVRGLSSSHSSFNVADMRPTGVTLRIDGTACDEYVVKFSPSHVERLYLDPNKDYVVIRHQSGLSRTDVTYRRHETVGWLPSSWKRTKYLPSKAVASSMLVNVVTVQVNSPQQAELFDITFPPQCEVFDQRDNKDYLVQEDGSMREVSATGELLSRTVSQTGSAWYVRNKWLLGLCGTLLITSLVLYVLRRTRRI